MNARVVILFLRICGGLMLFFSVGWLIAAAIAYHLTSNFVGRAVACQGTVVQMNSRPDNNGNTTYYPVFTYADSTGKVRTSNSTTSTNPPQYSVGEKISLIYDPRDPQDVRTNSFWSLWIIPIIFAGIGVLVLLLGMVFLFVLPMVMHVARTC